MKKQNLTDLKSSELFWQASSAFMSPGSELPPLAGVVNDFLLILIFLIPLADSIDSIIISHLNKN
jgi:hypothetical protein